ncbi:hypothetical protein ABZ438_07830 [Streptomyces sp. NPDC005786]|uniref:hypothetical protein n=1 Tax=Streptomyces sp. NPDC005786 TaxID=3154891 RepID=UPI0033DDD3E9
MNDNCPACTRPDIPPITGHTAGNQASHLYRCPGCGHIWATNRDLGAYGQEAA